MTEKKIDLSSDFIPWALSAVFLYGKISLNFGITLHVSLSIKDIEPLK